MKAKRAIVLTAVVVALVAGTAAYASIPDRTGVIHSCYSQAQGTWRPIDTETNPPQKCKSGETALNWNQTGPQGPAGPQGAQGPAGQQGPKGDKGDAGPSDAYDSSDGIQLFDIYEIPGGAGPVVLADLNVPFGEYVVYGTGNAQARLLGHTAMDCDLRTGYGTAFANVSIDFTDTGGSELIPFTLVGTVVTTGHLQLTCTGFDLDAYVTGPRLVATKVGATHHP